MAKKKTKKETDAGTLGRLSKRGEEAVSKLVDELTKNERVTEALARAMSAKGKVEEGSRKALGQVGVAASDELKDLRKHIDQLEKRLAKLEGAKPKPAAKTKPGAKTPASTATTRSRAKKTPADTPSPAPGRAVGGGTGRGSGAGGTAA